MANKVELDLNTAVTLQIPGRQVTKITTQFLAELRASLVRDGEVYLPGIGRLLVVRCGGGSITNLTVKRKVADPTHIKVFFKKAPALRSALKRKPR